MTVPPAHRVDSLDWAAIHRALACESRAVTRTA